METYLKNPIAVIGMHHSGSSLVSEMLIKYGVWIGWDIPDQNNESFYFQRIHKGLLRRHNEIWLSIERTALLLNHGQMLKKLAAEQTNRLGSGLWWGHFGIRNT